MEQDATLESLLKELLREVIREEINRALAYHQPTLKAEQTDTPEIMDITEAGNFLGISKATMYKKTASGEIAHYKTGKKLFFKRNELIEWITKVRIKPLYEIEQEAASYVARNRRRY